MVVAWLGESASSSALLVEARLVTVRMPSRPRAAALQAFANTIAASCQSFKALSATARLSLQHQQHILLGAALGSKTVQGNLRCRAPLDNVRVACRGTRQCTFRNSHLQAPEETLTARISRSIDDVEEGESAVYIFNGYLQSLSTRTLTLSLFCSLKAHYSHRRCHHSAKSSRVKQTCQAAALSWCRCRHTVRVSHRKHAFLVPRLMSFIILNPEVKKDCTVQSAPYLADFCLIGVIKI